MKYKILIGVIFFFSLSIVTAQNGNSKSTETIKKTYKVISNGKVVKNTVTISTETFNDVLADNSALENKKDSASYQSRVLKTVKIDNDADDDFDELIKFSYFSNVKTDFTLLTSNDELVVALDEGENLNILQNVSFDMDSISNTKEAFIFTSNDGEKVEFFIENYETM